MKSVVRNVRDIPIRDREALEHVVGQRLREEQQIVISVVTPEPPASQSPQAPSASAGGVLPEWCNVYEGLTDEEIDAIEASIVRSSSSRCLD